MKNKLFVFGLALFLSVSFVNFAHATDAVNTLVHPGYSVGVATNLNTATPTVDTANFTEVQKTALLNAKTLMDQAKNLQEQATKILKDAGITPKMMGHVEMKDKMKGDKGIDQKDNQGDHQDGEKVFDMKMPAKRDSQNMAGSTNPDSTKKTGDMKKPSTKKTPKKMGDKKEGDRKGGEGKGPFTNDHKPLPPTGGNTTSPAQNAPAVNQ